MTTNKLDLPAIKARHEAAKPPAHCKRCDWFKDVPVLLKEVERLKRLVGSAFREGGDEGMREGIKQMFDEDDCLWDHSKSHEALERE